MSRSSLLVLATLALGGVLGCGGSDGGGRDENASGEPEITRIYVTVEADAGRTRTVALSLPETLPDFEETQAILGTEDVRLFTAHAGLAAGRILRIRGLDLGRNEVWSRDVRLAGTDPEWITINPNALVADARTR